MTKYDDVLHEIEGPLECYNDTFVATDVASAWITAAQVMHRDGKISQALLDELLIRAAELTADFSFKRRKENVKHSN
jgi:hypothetical protein